MQKVTLSNYSILKGEKLIVRVEQENAEGFEQMQVEIYTAGVLNPAPALGIGTIPTITDDKFFEVEISTESLQLGLFEIPLIRFHSDIDTETPRQLDILTRSLKERVIFEVINTSKDSREKTAIYAEIHKLENEIELNFAAPFTIVEGVVTTFGYSVYVFVKDLLIGTRIRFPYFELIPTRAGLDTKDAFNFVNDFLKNSTGTNVYFSYTDDAKRTSIQSNPVCVIHFPNIEAPNQDLARDHCVNKSNELLLALALTRDAGGSVFDVVVFCHDTLQATKFAVTSGYIGNLLTGNLSGENPETLHTYLSALEPHSLETFLTRLYREARREKHVDFQYVRLWQILEILAEGEAYDATMQLRDFEGNLLFHDDGAPRLLKGSVNSVYALLRDNHIGNSQSTWDNVNMWFAIRSAVAHYGSVSKFENLRAATKEWAIRANREIAASSGHDKVLWGLKEDVKLLLQRRLVTRSKVASNGN